MKIAISLKVCLRYFLWVNVHICFLLIISTFSIFADSTGVRAAFSRLGIAGAHNLAMGGAVEAVTDDVFSVFWNPAGLTQLRSRKKSIREDVRTKLQQNQIDKITERDLKRLSDDTPKFFFQLGAAASKLQEDREAAFVAGAFNLGNTVLGMGVLGIYSDKIATYSNEGVFTGDTSYQAGVSYLSVAYPTEYVSIGVTAKTFYENIDRTNFAGGAFDAGIQTDFIPLVQIGVVVQDIGVGLMPIEKDDEVKNEYEFGKPVFRFNIALVSRTANMVVSAGIIKKFEDKSSDYKLGIRYYLLSNFAFMLGVNESLFTTGTMINFFDADFSYAVSVDNIDMGYNHTVSFSYLF
ncbi:MAG TPA: hypothetical protein P5123_07980 [Spirochaetota bacterium]|nr:hypothetical protein [Spirochaetota bacterium]